MSYRERKEVTRVTGKGVEGIYGHPGRLISEAQSGLAGVPKRDT